MIFSGKKGNIISPMVSHLEMSTPADSVSANEVDNDRVVLMKWLTTVM